MTLKQMEIEAEFYLNRFRPNPPTKEMKNLKHSPHVWLEEFEGRLRICSGISYGIWSDLQHKPTDKEISWLIAGKLSGNKHFCKAEPFHYKNIFK